MVKNKYERIKKQRGPKRLVNNREVATALNMSHSSVI